MGNVNATTPPTPHQDGKRMQGGGQNCRDRGGLRRKKEKIDWGDGEKRNIRDDMPLSAQSEAMTSRSHNDQQRSLNNKKCLSKTKFLKDSKSYRLVSTFVSSRHRALTMINLDHYIKKLDEACHQALTVRPAIEHSQ